MECEFYDVGCHYEWLIAEIKLLFVFIVDNVLQAVAGVFIAIPVPSFLLNVGAFGLSSDVLFFTTLFQVPFGLGIVVTAYIARFVLRRIPIIG